MPNRPRCRQPIETAYCPAPLLRFLLFLLL
jgi:hypothetical protein